MVTVDKAIIAKLDKKGKEFEILMKLEYSKHWLKKKSYRKDISDDFIIYAIQNSAILKDKYWEDALNSICRIPPSGRLLKVVYKRLSKDRIKIITTFWLD